MIRTKRFRIEHNGDVTGVGFRPTLCGRGISDYGLHVCPRNIGAGLVEVILKGEEEDIKRFHRDVANLKIRPEGVREYLTNELEGYEGEVDFNLCSTGLILEQMGTFVDSAKELTQVTRTGFENQGRKFDDLGRKFDELAKAIKKALR